jgi:cell division protein FtsN
MYRRRRRRSSFARRAPPQLRYAAIGVAAAVVIGLFVFFIGQADKLAPAPQEIRVEVQDAFKE